MPDYSIRPARPKDEVPIRKLVALYPDKLIQDDHPQTDKFLVAEASDGSLLGCCALDVYSKRLAEIRSLAVHADSLRSGVGAALVAACKKRARDLGVRQLLAVTSAVEFFERTGFSTFRQERTALFYDVAGE